MKARGVRNGAFTEYFERSYDFESVGFSHGSSMVRGDFKGHVQQKGQYLIINGRCNYQFSDRFTDPVDIRDIVAYIRETPDRVRYLFQIVADKLGLREGDIPDIENIGADDVYKWFILLTDLGGTAYNISGTWMSEFHAKILLDNHLSQYKNPSK